MHPATAGAYAARVSTVGYTSHVTKRPERIEGRAEDGSDGRGWDRTSDLPRVNGERMGTVGD
jgi:hypothetical protein